MSVETELRARSGDKCELCSAAGALAVQALATPASAASALLICEACQAQIDDPSRMDAEHWRCLGESMWSTEPAVQAMAYRLLDRLAAEPWALAWRDMLYLDEAVMALAREADAGPVAAHLDAHGAVLAAGDTVTLIKDLAVKGAGFTAKRGTSVRGISLVADNPAHIEGRVNGQQIVILTEFVKKSG